MRARVTHSCTYRYSAPVLLGPHRFGLKPRGHGFQKLLDFRLEVSPDPFLMAVAVAASCAFLTPIGHQNNTLILGPGGFRFGDYWRLGLPVQLAVLLVSLPMLLWAWPL